MILLAVTSATTITIVRAPYSGTPAGYDATYRNGCGGSGSTPFAPTLNLTTGHGHQSVRSAQRSCGNSISTSATTAYVGFFGSTFTPAVDVRTFKIVWDVAYTVNLSAIPGGSGEYVVASTQIFGYDYITDRTNGTYVYQTGAIVLSNNTTDSQFRFHAPHAVVTSWINSSFLAGHNYTLFISLEVYAYSAAGPGSSAARASVDMSSGDNGAKLRSISYW